GRTGPDRGSRLARDGTPAGGRQRGCLPHRARGAGHRRRRRRRAYRRPADPAPAYPREVRLDAALAAAVAGTGRRNAALSLTVGAAHGRELLVSGFRQASKKLAAKGRSRKIIRWGQVPTPPRDNPRLTRDAG